MSTMEAARTEYSAREFNHDPSAISRAARALGRVRITNRGVPSLIVLDAARYPEMADGGPSVSLLDSLTMTTRADDALIGEPPRATIDLRFQDAA